MRQFGMWLTLIGFACIVIGLISLLSEYNTTMDMIRPQLDKMEKGGRSAFAPVGELKAKLKADETGEAELSDEEKLKVYADLVKGLEQRVEARKDALQVDRSIEDINERFRRSERRARVPLGIGLVLAIVGVVLLVAATVKPAAEQKPAEQAAPQPEEKEPGKQD